MRSPTHPRKYMLASKRGSSRPLRLLIQAPTVDSMCEAPMSVTQLIAQTAVTFIAAAGGALLGAFLTRQTERFKHLQELRSAAYADFLRGVATAAEDSLMDNLAAGSRAMVADSRARIAIYGGENVVRSLSEFIALGAQTCNREGIQAFVELCRTMRAETGREHVSVSDIKRVLFN